jgi:hypothetical protein
MGSPALLFYRCAMDSANISSQDSGELRRRVIEYMGGEGDDADSATCGYITRCDRGEPYSPEHLHPPAAVDRFIDRRHDLARSLCDRRSMLVHLDVEYVDFDDPLAGFRDPRRAFAFQEPVVEAILGVLRRFGISPLHLLTGQGHHFVWRVNKESRAARMLRRICPERDDANAESDEPWSDEGAFTGTGLVVEWLAHRVLEMARPGMEIPVSLTAVMTGPGRTGRREVVSIDLSEYGDPLRTRTVRVPFTPYHKPQRWNAGEMAGFDILPVNGHSVEEMLELRRDAGAVREMSRGGDARIPLAEPATVALIEAYLGSSLRRFHRRYFAARPDPPEIWDRTYRRTPFVALPACARVLAERPNDALLKPAGMQHLTRCLIAQGWHPRHVGGLIGSIFADPRHGWGDRWRHYDPARRADFYMRIFSGLMVMGLDGLVDFNCVSAQEKGLCPWWDACAGLERWHSDLQAALMGLRTKSAQTFAEIRLDHG